MRYSGKALTCFCLMLIALWGVITALKWPIKVGLFPVIIGSLICLMALTELLFNLFGKEEGDEEPSGLDFKLSEYSDRALAKRRTISIFLWILGFFFLILLVGFSFAIPVFFILFLKVKGKEGWIASLGLTAIAWVSFYGLFVWFLKVLLPEGLLQTGLKAIGIG